MSVSRTLFASITIASLVLAQEPAAKADAWVQDFAKAKEQAAKEGKDLLIDFTGSDWCFWCKRLDKEVFAEAAFADEAPKSFVLVKLDFPSDESLVTAEIKAQNEKLKEQYAVEGFPTVFLTDAEGKPYAQTGYQKGGASKYMEHLAELKAAKTARDAAFAKAKDQKGADRAKSLAEGLDALANPDLVLAHYVATIDEILGLDADGKAGLKDKYSKLKDRYSELKDLAEQEKVVAAMQQDFLGMDPSGDWDGFKAKMDEVLAANKGRKTVEQMATFFKAIAFLKGGEDFDSAIPLLESAQAIDKESDRGKEIGKVIAQVKRKKADKAGKTGGEEKQEETKEGKKEGKGI